MPGRRRFFTHYGDIVLEIHPLVVQPLDRDLFEQSPVCKDRKFTLLPVHPDIHPFLTYLTLHIVGLVAQLQTTLVIKLSLVGLTRQGQHPAIWINSGWNRG